MKNATQDRGLSYHKKRLDFAYRNQSRPRLEAMVSLAKSDARIAVRADQFDRHSMLFVTPSGTIDLKTGGLRENRQEDYITTLCPTPFDPAARCPLWEKTLLTILGGDEALCEYFQRLAGYSMTGDVREQILPICHGGGSNGKSLVFSVLQSVLGPDYSSVGAEELLRPDRERGHPTHIADLYGKRLVTLAETAEGGKLNEQLVKRLTGGERIKARRMREDPWEFTPTHKIWLATNHRPTVPGVDHGIWRRLRLIPFNVTFWNPDAGEQGPEHLKIDSQLLAKIIHAEAPGILAWMVRGCLAWQQRGLPVPNCVRLSTANYRAEQDVVGTFLSDCCILGPDQECQSSWCYTAYQSWHKKTGQEGHPMSHTKLSSQLILRDGVEKVKSSVIKYKGISIRPQNEQPDA